MTLFSKMIKNALVFFTASALVACGGYVYVDNDQRPVEEVVRKAEELIKSKAYAAAAKEYAIAIQKQPENGKYYLRQAELFERIDEDNLAEQAYERGLKNVPEEDPEHLKIMHRLALINANHLFRIDEAEELMLKMPDKSIEKYDTTAFLYYKASQFDQAISLLNKALERVRTADMKALLLYHAALVYVELKDQKNTFGSLYFSINNAEHLGLIRDIEQLWEEINQDPESGNPIFPET